MSVTGFVEAYVSATGEKVRVPERWVDHPVLWRGLRKTPLSKAREASSAEEGQQQTTTDAAPLADTERK